MKRRRIRAAGRSLWLAAASLCLLTGLALPESPPTKASAVTWNPRTIVDFDVAVRAVHEVPRDNPLPGLHLEATVDSRITDIYIAPMEFVAGWNPSISVGDDIRVSGSLTRLGRTDIVLARQITIGRNTLFLRNDDGEPLWLPPAPSI